MAADEITRVRYFERQFLRAADFRDEQTYDRDARRRHDLAQHTWGIVTGLELLEQPLPDGAVDVVLQPGVAIDGFGRELVNYHPQRLDAALFDAFHTAGHQTIWIGYAEDESGALGSGWSDCQDAGATRITESWRLVVSPPPPTVDDVLVDGVAAASATAPDGTPATIAAGTPVLPADTSVPYQELPETSPGDRWLIQLGVVFWDGAAQRFTPADPAVKDATKLRYAGVVADHLLAPAKQLAIRRRHAEPDIDKLEFATVEGRLRAQGSIRAERDVWIEGDHVRFTYDAGDEDSVEMTLGRERPDDDPTGHRLRLRLGDTGAKASFGIGPGVKPKAQDVLRVAADDTVTVPTGTLSFAAGTRQMIDLYATPGKHEYGIGVQNSTLYLRSDAEFCWFRGGKHDPAASVPGDGGVLQMRLDADGDLYFGSRVRQMLNLWGARYGIGVQDWTLYFRADADFCWYRGGAARDGRGDPGGGALAMKLDDASHLHVSGPLTTGGDAVVNGGLQVVGQAPSVIKVWSVTRVKQNTGQGATVWTEPITTTFDEVFSAFVVLNGFSAFPQDDPMSFEKNMEHWQDTAHIVEHAYVAVQSHSNTSVTLRAYCQQSDAGLEDNNSILLTLVVLGRTHP